MTFVGFFIFENKLKPVTHDIINKLIDANLKVMMVTGDNPFTAINVALKCSILSSEKTLLFLGSLDTQAKETEKDLANQKIHLQKR